MKNTRLGNMVECAMANLLLFIFGSICFGIMIVGLVGLIHYERVVDLAPSVTGTLTGIEEYTDSEGDTTHYLLVDYEYNGRSYQARFDSCSYKEGQKRLGERVSFLINPEDHGTLLHRTRETKLIFFYFGLVAFGFF